MDDDERTALAADLKTAALAGGGLGLALLGFLIPILSIVGLMVCYFGWRSARSDYRVGRVFAVIGMVLGFLGVGALITDLLATR